MRIYKLEMSNKSVRPVKTAATQNLGGDYSTCKLVFRGSGGCQNDKINNLQTPLVIYSTRRTVTQKHLASVVEKLNNQPRKCLGYQTHLEVFIKNTGGALRT
ncbi:MAG: hypothetical protein DRR06_05985 [Gammaproteobacteria bacterium]|nr:MAG: hypothetical protein DRR06_05985 [Gammaproteobacteria bacterium]RLA51155.1 MAG: hypothetical protein DRR42_11105 [Gammaproteobacteria bacterium]